MKNNKSDMEESERKELNKLVSKNSKNDLLKLCKERNLDCKGTKFELGMRLLGKKKKKMNHFIPPTIIIYKNQFGNYEHQRTGFLFNQEKRVFGKQNEDGTISQLECEDIMTCRQYKFLYELPEQLNEELGDTKLNHAESSDEEEEDEEPVMF